MLFNTRPYSHEFSHWAKWTPITANSLATPQVIRGRLTWFRCIPRDIGKQGLRRTLVLTFLDLLFLPPRQIQILKQVDDMTKDFSVQVHFDLSLREHQLDPLGIS